MTKKWQLAMFDWDGTLYNSLMLAYGSVIEIFKSFGLTAPALEYYREHITADFMQFYWAFCIPKTATGDELNKIRRRYFEEHKHEAHPNEWTKRVLLECQMLNIPAIIVSAGVQINLEQQLKDHQLASLVTHIRGGAYDKERALREMLDLFGVKAENAFYVDDTHDGLLAAKKAGIYAVGHAGEGAYHSKERIMAAADLTIESLRDLLPILRNEVQP